MGEWLRVGMGVRVGGWGGRIDKSAPERLERSLVIPTSPTGGFLHVVCAAYLALFAQLCLLFGTGAEVFARIVWHGQWPSQGWQGRRGGGEGWRP